MGKTVVSLIDGSSFMQTAPACSRKDLTDSIYRGINSTDTFLSFVSDNDTTIIFKDKITKIVVTGD